MSVAIYPVITTEQQLRAQLENGDFLEQVFEEESIDVEELPTEDHVSADLLSCYEQFADDLPEATQKAFAQFADIVCWDYRDVPQPLESSFQPEGIHFSCSPDTCTRLANAVASLDRAAIEGAFSEDSTFEDAAQFIAYLEAWGDIFRRAADSKRFVFAFIP